MKRCDKTVATAALVHMESAMDHYQAIHALSLPEDIKRALIIAQKVGSSIAEDIQTWGGIKPEEPAIFLPAFPKTTQRHL